MAASTSYGSITLGTQAERTESKKKSARTYALLAIVCLLGVSTYVNVVVNNTGDDKAVSVINQEDIPDCQCLGYCNTPDTSHQGTWCYINTDISPCVDSSRYTIYGQSWARCSVIYGDDDCRGDPCQNSAICVDKYDGYECNCRPGWSGDDCSTRVLIEYTVHMTTSDVDDSGTDNAISVTFTGTEGDVTQETMLFLDGIGKFEREYGECPTFDDNPGYRAATITAPDVGELHKITYSVGGDDSMDLSQIKVEYKGVTYVAVGDIPPAENSEPQTVTLVQGREYTAKITALDYPSWAATKNDVYLQLTGEDWEVSGSVVVLPGGIDDGYTCEVDFYGADIGVPAKVTYWVRDSDSLLPKEVVIDDRYAAQITTGERCVTSEFLGDDDTGKGYAFQDASCAADDDTDGCTGTEGCRWCVLWDPVAEDDEILCPWSLPYTNGQFIIIDLVDLSVGTNTTTVAE